MTNEDLKPYFLLKKIKLKKKKKMGIQRFQLAMKMINLLKKKKKKRVFVIILHLNYLINYFLCCFVILLRLDFVIYQIFWLNLFFIDSLPYVLRSFFLRFIFPLPYQIFFSHSSFICFGAVVFEFFTFLLWLFLYFFSIYS